MKKLLILGALTLGPLLHAQSNANEIFAAGLDDARRFTNDYMAPVSEASIYSISGSWFNSAEAKSLGAFEIGVVGNFTMFGNKEDKKSFLLDTSEYENLQFVSGPSAQQVATALGDREGIRVFVEAEVAPGVTSREEFTLPTGLSGGGINFIPSGFLQGSVGFLKGTEFKARFLPRITTDEVSLGLYGAAIQNELTRIIPGGNLLPVNISTLVGYTHLDGSYDFTRTSIIDGSDQRIEVDINTWNIQTIVSTKLPVINFYSSVGYVKGTSVTQVLGTYTVTSGPFQESYVDPMSEADGTQLEKGANGMVASAGARLKLGFFRLHADYSIGAFNNLSVGMNFGFR